MFEFSVFDLVLLAATLVSGFIAWRKGRDVFFKGLKDGASLGVRLVPAITLGLLAAGFLSEALPERALAGLVGRDSGMIGILIATAAGAVTPGGPIITFPVLIALAGAGAGAPQMLAFVTSWSTLAMNRVLVWEIPLMGIAFVRRRLLVSAAIPVLVGLIYWAGAAVLPGIFDTIAVLQPRP